MTRKQSNFIPPGTALRLQNPGRIALHPIEVQSGSDRGKGDIVRLPDDCRQPS